MTSNYLKSEELKENKRSNIAKEKETERSNRANEKLKKRGQNMDLARGVMNTATDIMKAGSGTTVTKMLNSPEWYSKAKQLVKDVASLSYHTPLGQKFKSSSRKAKHVPGIMSIRYIPSVGFAFTNLSDNNILRNAIDQLYAYVRHANSGSRNYEAPDLGKYFLAVSEAMQYHASLTRIYSLVMSAKSENRYWINGMLTACGVDPNDIRNNIANLRQFINSFALRINTFYVPNTLSLFARRYWLNTSIFKDQPIHKSQDYLFVQQNFGIYNFFSNEIQYSHRPNMNLEDTITPDKLCPDFKAGANIKFSELQALGNYMITSLLATEDVGIMSGDVLKAYGPDKCLFIKDIDENYHIESQYSLEVLSQITNTVLNGEPVFRKRSDGTHPNETGFNIYEKGRALVQGMDWVIKTNVSDVTPDDNMPTSILFRNAFGNSFLSKWWALSTQDYIDNVELDYASYNLNMYKDEVTPDDNMVATRMTTVLSPVARFDAGSAYTATEYGTVIINAGTEIATSADIITFNDDPEGTEFEITTFNHIIAWDKTTVNDVSPMDKLTKINKFDWAPKCLFIAYGGAGAGADPVSVEIVGTTEDVANNATVSAVNLGNMHYVAIMSEYGIPQLGATIRQR